MTVQVTEDPNHVPIGNVFLRWRSTHEASRSANQATSNSTEGWVVHGLGYSPRATENGHEAVAKMLLDTGKVDVDARDTKYGRTPLSLAARVGKETVVKMLLDTGKVDVDARDTEYGRTPLSWATENGHEAVVRMLLDTEKVDVDSKDNSGQTPLSLAARVGNAAVVKMLRRPTVSIKQTLEDSRSRPSKDRNR